LDVTNCSSSNRRCGSAYLKARLQAKHPENSCDWLLSAIKAKSQTKSSDGIKKHALLKIYTTVLLQCTTCFLCWLIKTFLFPSLYLLHIPILYPFLYNVFARRTSWHYLGESEQWNLPSHCNKCSLSQPQTNVMLLNH